MKSIIYIFVVLISFVSCEEKIPDIVDEPNEVKFKYNGNDVTYSIVKKEYVIDEKGDSLKTHVTFYWLDRNLGAKRQATVKNDPLAAGDLFQWGRLDDGHQDTYSETTDVFSTNIIPGHNYFITSPLGTSDWLKTPNKLLWNGDDNINCPCPKEWRIPTIEELEMEMRSWTSNNMVGAYNSTLKWVAGGSRDNHGKIRYTENWAFIWSSSVVEGDMVKNLAIIGGNVSEVITSPKIFGNSVRCIKRK